MLRVGTRAGNLVGLVEERDAGKRLQFFPGQRPSELPIGNVRAGPEALRVAGSRMRVRDLAFPVIRVPLPKRTRQAPGVVVTLVDDVNCR